MFSHDTNPFLFKDSLNLNYNKKLTGIKFFFAVFYFVFGFCSLNYKESHGLLAVVFLDMTNDKRELI